MYIYTYIYIYLYVCVCVCVCMYVCPDECLKTETLDVGK